MLDLIIKTESKGNQAYRRKSSKKQLEKVIVTKPIIPQQRILKKVNDIKNNVYPEQCYTVTKTILDANRSELTESSWIFTDRYSMKSYVARHWEIDPAYHHEDSNKIIGNKGPVNLFIFTKQIRNISSDKPYSYVYKEVFPKEAYYIDSKYDKNNVDKEYYKTMDLIKYDISGQHIPLLSYKIDLVYLSKSKSITSPKVYYYENHFLYNSLKDIDLATISDDFYEYKLAYIIVHVCICKVGKRKQLKPSFVYDKEHFPVDGIILNDVQADNDVIKGDEYLENESILGPITLVKLCNNDIPVYTYLCTRNGFDEITGYKNKEVINDITYDIYKINYNIYDIMYDEITKLTKEILTDKVNEIISEEYNNKNYINIARKQLGHGSFVQLDHEVLSKRPIDLIISMM